MRFSDSHTFGSILERHRGEGPGFGILRLGLAVWRQHNDPSYVWLRFLNLTSG
jgi:hypothetical protein